MSTGDPGDPGCGDPTQPPCVTYTMDGTITTDGTLGSWYYENHILDIDLVLSDGTNSALLTRSNYTEIGSALLSATPEGLLQVNFGIPGFAFYDESDPDSYWAFCTTVRADCWERAGLSGQYHVELPTIHFSTPSTLGVAVPELRTALALGLGLGLMAGYARRRRRQAAPPRGGSRRPWRRMKPVASLGS